MSNKKKRLIIFGVIGGMVLLLVIGYLNLYEYGKTINYYAPAWSPDGKRIIYFKWVDNWKHVWFMGALGWIALEDEYYICTIDLEGKDEKIIRRVEGAATYDTYISWNPNTNKIVYSIYNGIYVMNADGTDCRKLSDTGTHPDWSPNGEKIIYVEKRELMDSKKTIWIMNADGSGKHQLVDMSGAYDPVWSPKGDKIAFTHETPNDVNIWIVNSDGSEEYKLARGDSPLWHPSGDKIIYRNYHGGTYSINVDGTENKRMQMPKGVSCYENRLSPDGTKLFKGLGIIDINTGAIRRILTSKTVNLTTGEIHEYR